VIEQLTRQPSGFWETVAIPMQTTLQENLARHINAASPAEITFVTTTSMAINMFAQALCWQPGENIVICDVEFPSNAYPWLSLARDGIEIRRVPAVKGGLSIEPLEKYVDENTRLIAASSVQFFSGHRTDLMAIGSFCHRNHILFAVDAIQSIGHIPLDVQAMHIDMLATGGQKSLLALPGTGFLYVRNEVAEMMHPRIIGSNATKDYIHWLAYDLAPMPGAARFNGGTPNLPGIFSIDASLSLITELGIDHIDHHTRVLSRYACHKLAELGLEVITPEDALGPIVTFRSAFSVEDTDRLVRYLADRQIVVVKHLDETGNPYIRLSFHCFNQTHEIDSLSEAYQAWLEKES
jgi:cysteine desulfurase / selenocysteine lyase